MHPKVCCIGKHHGVNGCWWDVAIDIAHATPTRHLWLSVHNASEYFSHE